MSDCAFFSILEPHLIYGIGELLLFHTNPLPKGVYHNVSFFKKTAKNFMDLYAGCSCHHKE